MLNITKALINLHLDIYFIIFIVFGLTYSVILLFRDHTRMITSLPVSPSSSPLRYGPEHRSCFYSPPHPTYTLMGQNSNTLYDTPYPARSNATFTLDPWHETSRYKAHTPPGGSPRMRFIWVDCKYIQVFPACLVVCGCTSIWTLKHKLVSKRFWSILYTLEPDQRRNEGP